MKIFLNLINTKHGLVKYFDHGQKPANMFGDWKDHRDCHIKPELVLIYRKPNNEVLQLVRTGSHSELSL